MGEERAVHVFRGKRKIYVSKENKLHNIRCIYLVTVDKQLWYLLSDWPSCGMRNKPPQAQSGLDDTEIYLQPIPAWKVKGECMYFGNI